MTKPAFILPSEPFNIKQCDSAFEDLYEKLKENNFNVYFIDIENLDSLRTFPREIEDSSLIYKGWMLTEDQYKLLFKATKEKLLVTPESYLNSHHSIFWYEKMKDFHATSFYTTEEKAKEDFTQLNWGKVFIKDYVKSLKTGKGSIVDSVDDIDRAIDAMKQYKGFIEGGIVFNEVIDLVSETEIRTFIFEGKLYSNEELKVEQKEFLYQIMSLHNEPFYSIDIAEDKQGKLYLIEVGDGQVSDLVGWDMDNFIKIFQSKKLQNKMN